MTNMIERVAFAILESGQNATYDELARAAIAAMREPTAAMLSSGIKHHGRHAPRDNAEELCWKEDLKCDWQAMINAALGEDKDDE